MSAQGWCNAITLTAQLSARTRQQRYGAYAPLRMPAAPKEGDRHLLSHFAKDIAKSCQCSVFVKFCEWLVLDREL